jgi:hypothetical protein
VVVGSQPNLVTPEVFLVASEGFGFLQAAVAIFENLVERDRWYFFYVSDLTDAVTGSWQHKQTKRNPLRGDPPDLKLVNGENPGVGFG